MTAIACIVSFAFGYLTVDAIIWRVRSARLRRDLAELDRDDRNSAARLDQCRRDLTRLRNSFSPLDHAAREPWGDN